MQTAPTKCRLLAKHKQLSVVAGILKKSKPWCSKHLAVTLPDFSKVAKDMLKSGECEDLEILCIINQLDKLGCHDAIQALRNYPPLTRAKARAALKFAKADESGNEQGEREEGDGQEGKRETLTDEERAERASDLRFVVKRFAQVSGMPEDRAEELATSILDAFQNPDSGEWMVYRA